MRQIVDEFDQVCRDLGVDADSSLARIPGNGLLTSADRHGVLGGQSLRGHARMLADLGVEVGCFELGSSKGRLRPAGANASEDLCLVASADRAKATS